MEWIEESELKRFFRARMKLNSAGTISHLTQRAAGADLLFHEDDDYMEFLRRMKEVARNYQLEIRAPIVAQRMLVQSPSESLRVPDPTFPNTVC